jgi:hypothetical protein
VSVPLARKATGAGVWANQKDRSEVQAAPAPRPPASPLAKPVPEVVATVDGTPITRDQLIERCLERYGARELDKLVWMQVLRQAGKDRGTAVTTEDLEREARTIADRLGLTVDEWYRKLEADRELPKPVYLRDVLYPSVMVRRLQATGQTADLEVLRRQAHVEVFLDAPRRDEPGVEKARAGAPSQEDRFRAIERRLDETIKALDHLKREVGR